MSAGAYIGFLTSFVYLILSTRHVAPVVKFDALFFGFIGCIIATCVGGIVGALLAFLFKTFKANVAAPKTTATGMAAWQDGWETAKAKLYWLFQATIKIIALIGLIMAVYTAFCR